MDRKKIEKEKRKILKNYTNEEIKVILEELQLIMNEDIAGEFVGFEYLKKVMNIGNNLAREIIKEYELHLYRTKGVKVYKKGTVPKVGLRQYIGLDK